MMQQIMDCVAHIPKVTMGDFVARFTRALLADDINEYCTAFSDYIKLFPHNILVDREKFFQATFYGMGLLSDAGMIASEVATLLRPAPEKACGYEGQASEGYVDIVLHGAKKTYIMEFKKDKSPEIAFQQILAKKYYEPHVIKGEQVVLVGINFDAGITLNFTRPKGRGIC
jgi:hypothetical protein